MKRKDSIFTDVPIKHVKKNYFDLSHEVKMTGKFGWMYPIMVMDCLPGDVVNLNSVVFARAAPLIAPVMHRCDIKTHTFFVPNRLLTDFWEDFITGGQDGTEEPVLPYITPAGIKDEDVTIMGKGTIWDYLGLPVVDLANEPLVYSTEQISALPFRAYVKIWNDYYRDPNFDQEFDLGLELQGDVSEHSRLNGHMSLRRHMWRKDLFTSALPWAQRGQEVLLPVSVRVDQAIIQSSGQPTPAPGNVEYEAGGGLSLEGGSQPIWLEGDNASGTINDFRRSLAIQAWLENNARGGYRYIEQIEHHFNQRVPDYRLQRAEYIGGSSQPLQISEVLSTFDNIAGGLPQGNMSGHGISVGKGKQRKYVCQEHGFLISIMHITPQTAYMQGIERLWSRKDKFDYAWPELAHIGEQEVVNREVFFSFDQADDIDNVDTFGYVPRNSEYKFKQDRIAGDFRDTLDFWHLGRIFLNRPVLGSQFTTVYEDGANEESYRRIFAVKDGTDYFWFQIFHKIGALRPLPYFGVPKLVG